MIQPNDEHNQALTQNVHPSDWKNPVAKGRYNLVVVGAGTAGLVTAAGAAGLGAKVALIEKHLMGGDCLNVGCVPSKALLSAAHIAHTLQKAASFGVRGGEAGRVDFASVMERMRRLRAGISRHDSAKRFSGLGVDVFFGDAKFVSPETVDVQGQILKFARAVVATGARAAAPPITGLTDTGYLTNESVFSLTTLPPRLGIIGAGPIGCEMAQAFRRLGADVTVLAKDPVVLPREDAAASQLLGEILKREGVALKLGIDLVSVNRSPEGKQIVWKTAQGTQETLTVDEILVAAGRAPNVEDMGLEAAGVRFDKHKGVEVDDHLRTTNKRIFAAGDVAGSFQFTHAADAMARIVIKNALFFGRDKLSGLVVPWATYTDPEVAHVGLSESEAERRGLDVSTHQVDMNTMDRAIVEGDTDGFARVIVDKKGFILGATIVARHAGEMIAPIVLAMTSKQKLSAVGATIFPYPTQTEVLKRVADAANRDRLTPTVKSLLARFLKWRR